MTQGRAPKNLGAAWVIQESYGQELTSHLVGLINSRRSYQWVTEYLRQLHVDRYWDFHEKVAFKKSAKVGPTVFSDTLNCYLAVQSETKITLSAVKAKRIHQVGHEIEILYPFATGEWPHLKIEEKAHRVSLRPRN